MRGSPDYCFDILYFYFDSSVFQFMIPIIVQKCGSLFVPG